MVYDPVRDREVPSPATVLSQHRDIWRDFSTPGSSFSSTGEETRVITNRRSQPPAFDSSDMRSPIVLNSRSVSGGLRGLLNDEADVGRRRSSEQRSSISSTLEEEGSRASIHHLLNDTPAPVIHSRSSTSLAHSTSPSNPSPSARHHPLDPNSLLAPTTPAPNYPHHHRTSNRTENIGSVAGPMSLSQHDTHYTTPQIEPRAGPSRPGQSVGPSYRPMLPPHDLPPQYFDPAIRVTPNSSHVPLRSISVSLSPRSYHTGLPVYNASRPSSTTSTPHSFSNPPPLPSLSPPMSSRAFSEEHSHQPSSGSNSNGRRGAVPLRRSSQVTPIFSPLYAKVRSTSPPPRPVYDPHRISRPSSVMRPIEEAEILHLRNLALSNNPLRQRTKRAIASWSNLSPGIRDSSVPSESSHFALQGAAGISKGPRRPTFQDDRISFSSSNGRASLTSDIAVYPTVSGARLADGFAGFRGTPPRDSGTHDEYHHRKRPSDRDDDDEHDRFRRKVSDAFSEARHAGNAGAVAHHYNARPEVGVEHRELSPIIGLKKFNNWIKSVLIGKFAWRPKGSPGANVLDIGCGKGGDLNKWKQARIRLYVGLDIAETSVQQARARYQKLSFAGFEGFMFAHDCFSKPISDVLPEDLQVPDLYDNVSMQFCMHYAFESASKARMMIENVCRYLRKGGIFIGSIPNAELLLNRLDLLPEDDQDLRFGNSCYYVQFAERRHKGTYGHQYRFFLSDAVEDVPEYLVNWDNFVSLAAEYRLRLAYKRPFNEVLQEEQNSRDFGPLLGKMGVINDRGASAMDPDQWEAANLYMAFAFEKQ